MRLRSGGFHSGIEEVEEELGFPAEDLLDRLDVPLPLLGVEVGDGVRVIGADAVGLVIADEELALLLIEEIDLSSQGPPLFEGDREGDLPLDKGRLEQLGVEGGGEEPLEHPLRLFTHQPALLFGGDFSERYEAL